MKRRTAILFFGFLSVLILGYLAWCGRFFYLRPGIAFDSAVPADVRAEITSWYVTQNHFKKEPFAWKRFANYLQHPWGMAVRPQDVVAQPVKNGTGNMVYLQHYSRPFRCLVFLKSTRGWFPLKEMHTSEIDMWERNYRAAKHRERQIYEFNRMPNMPEKWAPTS